MAGINLKSCKPDPPQKQKAFLPKKKGLDYFWLPLVDVLSNHPEGPPQGVIHTILVAQNQIKDGFLAPEQH
jgi:hypothetical protein